MIDVGPGMYLNQVQGLGDYAIKAHRKIVH